jgi:hypothetical protein
MVKLFLLIDVDQTTNLVTNFRKLINSLNIVQIHCFKSLSYSPWKKTSNTISFVPIIYIDLVSLSVHLSEWTEPHFFQDEAPFLHSSKIHEEVLRRFSLHKHTHITRTWYPQSIAAVWREAMTVGSHPSPIAPKADIKTFPSPPPPLPKEPAVI